MKSVQDIVAEVQSRAVVVGNGVTISCGSDRYPGTIVEVETINNRLYVTIQEDFHKRVDSNGMSESQEYEYSPNPDAIHKTFRMNKYERWEPVFKNEETGRWKKGGYGYLFVGEREYYYDYSK